MLLLPLVGARCCPAVGEKGLMDGGREVDGAVATGLFKACVCFDWKDTEIIIF